MCRRVSLLSLGLYDFAVESVACGMSPHGPTRHNELRRGGRRGETASSLIVRAADASFESIQRVRYADPTSDVTSQYQLRAPS